MVKYINKSALVAEIERRIDEVNQIDKASYEVGLFDAYKIILSFLDTLEVKEVNLEKELISWHKKHFKKEGTFEKYGGFYFANSSQLDLAKHFFELGLKAKIGGKALDLTPAVAETIKAIKDGTN